MLNNQKLIEALYQRRELLEQALDWQEANHTDSTVNADDGAEIELRSRIRSIRSEIAILERYSQHSLN